MHTEMSGAFKVQACSLAWDLSSGAAAPAEAGGLPAGLLALDETAQSQARRGDNFNLMFRASRLTTPDFLGALRILSFRNLASLASRIPRIWVESIS
jgi:hypothetical protein